MNHVPWAVPVALFLGSIPSTLAAQTAVNFQYPLSSAVAEDGTVFVADRKLPGIWKISGGKAEIFHQASKKFRTPLNAVWCVTFDSKGRLVAGDSATREIYRFDKTGKPTALTKGAIGIPICIAADGKGMLYVSDLETQRVWKVSEEGGKPEEFAVVSGPRGITVDGSGNVWLINSSKNQIVRFAADGKPTPVVSGRPFRFPHCIAVAKDGTAYVTDGYGKCIWKISSGGQPKKLAEGAPFVNPVGLTWRKDNLLATDPRAPAVLSVTPEGKVTRFAAGAAPKK